MGNRYTPDERQQAMDLAAARGYRYASDESGVPIGTLKSWMRRAGRTVQPERRAELEERQQIASLQWEARRLTMANELGEAAAKALARTVERLDGWTTQDGVRMAPNPREAHGAALTMAILIDKAQLLSGGATARTESLDTAMERAMEALDKLEAGMKGPGE